MKELRAEHGHETDETGEVVDTLYGARFEGTRRLTTAPYQIDHPTNGEINLAEYIGKKINFRYSRLDGDWYYEVKDLKVVSD